MEPSYISSFFPLKTIAVNGANFTFFFWTCHSEYSIAFKYGVVTPLVQWLGMTTWGMEGWGSVTDASRVVFVVELRGKGFYLSFTMLPQTAVPSFYLWNQVSSLDGANIYFLFVLAIHNVILYSNRIVLEPSSECVMLF